MTLRLFSTRSSVLKIFFGFSLILALCKRGRNNKMWFVVFGVLAIAGLIYYYMTVHFKRFKKLGIPGPTPKFPYGNMKSMMTQKRNMVYDYDDIYQ